MTDMTPDQLAEKFSEFKISANVANRRYLLRTYHDCFVGDEATQLLAEICKVKIPQAEEIGQKFLNQGLIEHVTGDHGFKNSKYFYRFKDNQAVAAGVLPPDGDSTTDEDGKPSEVAVPGADHNAAPTRGHEFTGLSNVFQEHHKHPEEIILPRDQWNDKLLANVHPLDWQNPDYKDRYNMVVIGAGSGGLVTAAICASLGAKVALIERHLMGGDCLNVGCVPSKALIRAARAVYEVKNAAEFGVSVESVKVDFGKIMERMRRLRSDLSDIDSAKRFNELGVHVFIGDAKFTAKDTVVVNGKTALKFSKCTIATGGRAGTPNIEGIKDVDFLTNETIFELTELPKRMLVIGSGAIGCEMAQSFVRFGSEVWIFARSGHLLGSEDVEAVEILEEQFRREKINMHLRVKYKRVYKNDKGEKVLVVEEDGKEVEFVGDALLVSAGRIPNVYGLGLEEAGVEYNGNHGVKINDYLQSTNPNVYAVGDVCSTYKFTHMSDAMARIVARNALFFGKGKVSALTVPWATYTEPEVAHVGLYDRDIKKAKTFKQPLEDNDRAVLEGAAEGFVKIHTEEGSPKILGATIVAANAGDMISEVSVAMAGNVDLRTLSTIIHPYPTQADAIRRCGDFYNRTLLKPTAAKLLKTIIDIRR
eukprot:Clim_evm140s147 gene=Clim_evmTU140s147